MRFAPRLRSSRLTRSPISSMTPSMAVATAEPMATAATVIAFRRGERRIDWLTKRRNISGARGLEDLHTAQELVGRDDKLIAFHARFEGDWIASAGGADRGRVNGGRAVFADDVRPALVVALAAADGAGIEGGGERAIGAADDDHAHRRAVG